MAIVFEGKKLAKEKEKKLAREVTELKKKTGISPKLMAIIMGKDSASRLYLRVKEKAAKRVGILFEKKKFPASAKPRAIVDFIKIANDDPLVHGIMVQLPLPKQLSIINYQLSILSSIDSKKDPDCLTPENLGFLMMGKPRFLPATVKAVMEIIDWALKPSAEILVSASDSLAKERTLLDKVVVARNVKPHKIWQTARAIRGVQVVIVGTGQVVGLPLAVHLKNLGATVTVCDEYTKNLAKHTEKAEILISATGMPGLIKKEMVKKGAVVIDVGSPRGDVDFEEVKKVASAITPVPGGVGPLTAISLLENVFLSAKASL